MFELGQVVHTAGLHAEFCDDPVFRRDVQEAFARYKKKDWGCTSPDGKNQNNLALIDGDRILAVYETSTSNQEKKEIWIITEADRSSTTVLFPSEY